MNHYYSGNPLGSVDRGSHWLPLYAPAVPSQLSSILDGGQRRIPASSLGSIYLIYIPWPQREWGESTLPAPPAITLGRMVVQEPKYQDEVQAAFIDNLLAHLKRLYWEGINREICSMILAFREISATHPYPLADEEDSELLDSENFKRIFDLWCQ